MLGERLRLACLVYPLPAASNHLDDGFQSLAWVSSCGMSLQSTQVASITFLSLLHPWAYLAMLGIILVHRENSWVGYW